MKKIRFLLLLLITVSCGAIEWPVKERILLSTFGENRRDHFHKGIDIGGGSQEIHPVDAGEVIFYREDSGSYLDFPNGLGAFIVLEHDRGFRSLYAHIKAETLNISEETVETDDLLGIIGETGSTSGKYLHLEIIDTEFNQVVNPLLLLPPLPDTQKPVIKAVQFERDNILTAVSDNINYQSGRTYILLDIRDFCEYVRYSHPMAPHVIDIFLNGEELYHISYEALKEKNGLLRLVQSDDAVFDDFYYSDWNVRLGPVMLNSGETRIEIITKDIAANENSKMISLNIE